MSWIRTYTGERFDPLSLNPGKVSIDDIAHALSNLCRFTGHTKKFYSVAQHSVLVSQILEDKGLSLETQLQGLLHDATEAYLNDIARPLKVTTAMRAYRDIEDRLEEFIASHWGFKKLSTFEVKVADMECLATETRDLMGDPQDWDLPYPPFPWKVVPQSPEMAKLGFFNRYFQLMKAMGRS